ncbi:RNA polymerase sigma factor [Actinokineospora bangkokensis]|uniref:RNA polymerase subunit sigma-70 n=1 Tax=Actinokineospora bangkokensis TaxID=1193682 RepID=A0A1Q9LIM4_9PSEU|nr:sigma-70 family RNA polymerase sigma factor [Actinokineospora bangkokensis]OLR91844.1 RNA polymerase subunit sigma-70 [Actinokineospora bangkokensis]
MTSSAVELDGSPGRAEDPADGDEVLVARARGGDVGAYERLVVRYQGPIFRFAVRMLGSRADAEDVTQEVFVAAWRRLSQLQTDAAFSGWLFRTASNRCLNLIRSRRPVAEEADAERLPAVGALGDPSRAAEAGAGMRALTEALAGLSPQLRVCWLLREVHGRSYEEIAQVVGVSGATVRGRIARARAQLVEVMSPWR